MFNNKYFSNFLMVFICMIMSYLFGLKILSTVDKRLSDISINIPKSSIVLKVKNENEHFTNFNPRDYADAQISCEEVDTSENDLLPKEDFEFLSNIIKRIQTRPILINHVLKILSNKPELSKINEGIDPNEGIKK